MVDGLYVDSSRPDDSGDGWSWASAKKTIQAAINSSVSSDTIIVTNGIYAPFSTGSKTVTIRSVNGANSTIIDGESKNRCATLGNAGIYTDTVLTGFTLKHGKTDGNGGGAYYGTLNNCNLVENTSLSFGGGAYYSKLNNCILIGNTAAYGGGSYSGTLNNCTLGGNFASYGGGSYSDRLNNSIVWGNIAESGANVYNSTSLYSCSEPLQSGNGNICMNPQFIDPENDDYRLRSGSPCIDVGANTYIVGERDVLGSPRVQNERIDLGAYEGGVPLITVTITFDPQGGIIPSFTTKYLTYESSYKALPTTKREGYTFAGWWTGSGGTGVHITPTTTVNIVEPQTLYAYWIQNAYMVTSEEWVFPVGNTNAVQVVSEDSGNEDGSVKVGGVGLLDDGEMAGIEWSVKGSGMLAFDWRVSSEEDWDILRFYEVGGFETNQISGTGQSWSRVEVRVGGDTNAVHTFRWEYEKDPISDFVGEDCGWIDAITWSPAHELVVNSGTGDGIYVEGDVVSIDAEVPSGNWKFDQWRGDTNGLADTFSSSTTLLMPSNSVVLTATYLPSELQRLDVFNGRGSGMYYENSLVNIIADPDPLYKEFARWTGDDAALLEDAYAPSTSLIMPTRLVSLTATYRDSIARVSGSYGHVYTEFGTEVGVSTDTGAGSPSGTASVKLGGSGVVANNGFAAFETTVFGSGSATFWWRTSSEVNDRLRFLVDGVEKSSISGTKIPWTWFSNRVEGAGASHVLMWEYAKDETYSSTTDAGWVDDIVWIGDEPVPAIAPDIQAIAHIGDTFKLIFWGERGIPYTVYSKATLSASGWGAMDVVSHEVGETNGVFCFEATITPPMEQKSGLYRVVGGGGIGDGDLYQTISVNPATAVHSSISTFTVLEVSPIAGYSYTWSLSNKSIGSLSSSSGTKVSYFTLSMPPSGSVIQTITVIGTDSNSGTNSVPSIKYRGTSVITHQAE